MVASEQHLFKTIVQFDKTIVLPRKCTTGSIHDYLFCYCPLVGTPFEVLRIHYIIPSLTSGQLLSISKALSVSGYVMTRSSFVFQLLSLT